MSWGTIDPGHSGQSARCMPVVPATRTDAVAPRPELELIVERQPLGRPTGGSASARWLAAGLGVLGACVIAAMPAGPRAARADGTAGIASASELDPATAALVAGHVRIVVAHPKSVTIEFPEDHALLRGQTMAIAGTAPSRPHASKTGVHIVEVEVVSRGALIGHALMPVYSGRYAGTITLVAAAASAPGLVRVRAADPPTQTWVERTVTIRADGAPQTPDVAASDDAQLACPAPWAWTHAPGHR